MNNSNDSKILTSLVSSTNHIFLLVLTLAIYYTFREITFKKQLYFKCGNFFFLDK